MADSLQKLQNIERKVGQTWGQAFENVDKTSEAFHKLVDEFVDFVGDWKEFSDTRKDMFADYIENLEDVQGSWEKINDWVSKNSDTLGTYVGTLTDIQKLFRSISTEIGGTRRQVQDNVNIARRLASIASDNLVALKQEGGLTDGVVRSLEKKSTKVREEYRTRLELLGVDTKNYSNILNVQDQERRKLDLVNDQIGSLKRLASQGIRLNAVEREQLRSLREQALLHESNLELLDENNRLAAKGLDERIRKQREYFSDQQKGNAAAGENALSVNRVSNVAKILNRFGLGEEARDLKRKYGEWATGRVTAKLNLEQAGTVKDHQQNVRDVAEAELERLKAQRQPIKDDLVESLNRDRKELSSIRGEKDYYSKLFQDTANWDKSAGRYRSKSTGEFVSEDDVEAYFTKVTELSEKEKSINARIQDRIESYKDFVRQVEAANRQVNIENSALEKANESLKDAQKSYKEAYQAFNLTGKLKDYFKEAYLHLGKWGGPLGAAIILITTFWRHLLKFDEEAVKTKRVIGQWADASALANTKFVSGTEVLKTMRDLGEQFHINPVQVFSPKELSSIAQAQKLTGMTAEAAGNLAVQSKITGKNVNAYRDSIAAGANQANKLNHSAVNLSAVQNDVLTTSRAIALSYGNNSERLARAAGAAAALGTNLQGVENIAKNLMNFESSIEAEMQAQLLTGMQLNLAKAREYALNNDLEGVTREIGRQGVNAAKFSHMNYIQQENMARALGMSREEMAKMLIMQEINNGLSAKQVAAMTGMRRQDIEALSAQEKWQTMKQRFLESLVPLLEPVLQLTSDILRLLNPILGIISKITGWISRGFSKVIPENWVYLRGLIGLIAVGLPVAIARGVLHVGVLGKAFKGLATLGVKVGKSIAGWATGLVKAGKSAQVTESIFSKLRPVRDYQGRTARQRLRDVRRLDRAREINPAGAAATSKASASMGSTISKLGKNISKIAIGAAAALMIAGAVFILAKAAQEFAEIDHLGKALLGAGAALIGLVGTIALLGAIMSSPVGTVMVLAGAAAMTVMAGAVWVLGNALKQVTAVPGNELQAIAGGIRAIAGAVGELAVKLGDLEVRKLNALGRAFKRLKGADIQVIAPTQEVETVATQVSRIQEESREPIRNPRENIKAAVQEITIKQAQVQASAQQISVEQKAADLSKIEQKMDRLERAINNLPRILSNDELSRGLNLALN